RYVIFPILNSARMQEHAAGERTGGTRKRRLKNEEIVQAFASDSGSSASPILSPQQLAAVLGISVKTVYDWVGNRRLDGCFRKRGKHLLIWRDRAIDTIFNGKEWEHE